MLIYNYSIQPETNIQPTFTAKPMTVSYKEIQACLDAGMRKVDIANKYGKSRGWVNWIMEKFGMQKPKEKTPFRLKKEAQAEQVLNGIRNGQSIEQVAKSMNVSLTTVYNLKKYIHPKTLEVALFQSKMKKLLDQLSETSKIEENLQKSLLKLHETPLSAKKPKMKEQILNLTEELECAVYQTCKNIKDKLNKV